MTQAEIAEKIAREAHKGQYRKIGEDKGKDYIVHPERIAKSLNGDLLKASAWLHDVLEDTNVTKDDLLKEGIEPLVVEIVETVSKKEGENYLDFILRIREGRAIIGIRQQPLPKGRGL